MHDLHFDDLRHTFATWLLEAGVDYIVIEYFSVIDSLEQGTCTFMIGIRVRNAVTRLAVLTERKLRRNLVETQKKPTRCH